MENEKIQLLAEQIENQIVQKYKRKFIGITTGFAAAIVVLGFLGFASLKDSVAQRAIDLLVDEQFEKQIIDSVSDSLSSPSSAILTNMKNMEMEADSILKEINTEHERVVEAATNEFGRTIEVLGKVRKEYSNTNNN